jgi:hypothetical protein
VGLSFVMAKLRSNHGAIYLTASDEGRSGHPQSLMNALSDVPVLIPLLVAAALILVFYLWITRTERHYSTDP